MTRNTKIMHFCFPNASPATQNSPSRAEQKQAQNRALSKNRISTEKIASNGAYGALGAQEASKNGPKLYILSKFYNS